MDPSPPSTVQGSRWARTNPPALTVGRTQCIKPQKSNVLFVPARTGPTTVRLLCGLPQQSYEVDFRFANMAGYYEFASIWDSGFGVLVDYDKTPLAAAAEGKPSLFAVTGVSEGMLDRAKVACVPSITKTPVALSVSPRTTGPAVTTLWCTDGTRIVPLKLDSKSSDGAASLWIENGPITVSYSMLSGGGAANIRGYFVYERHQTGPYPIADAPFGRAIGTKDMALIGTRLNNDERGWGPDFHRYTLVDDPLVGPIILCSAEDKDVQANICHVGETPISAYFSDEIEGAASPTRSGDNWRKQVIYTVLPGTIAKEFRSQAGGASRMIVAVDIQYQNMTRLGVVHANPD
jgi:hypothetical protein